MIDLKGVGFLMKNNIEVLEGYAKLKTAQTVEVKSVKGTPTRLMLKT